MGVWNPGPGPTEGDDTYTADTTGATASAGAGNDTFLATGGLAAGIHVFDGGPGFDQINWFFDPFVSGLTLSLSVAGPQAVGSGTYQFVSIENLGGGSGNDTLTGDQGNNNLWGYAGDDVLYGLGGDDSLFAYGGDDTLVGGDGYDSAYYEGNAADYQVVIDGATVHVSSVAFGNDTLTGIELLVFGDSTRSIPAPLPVTVPNYWAIATLSFNRSNEFPSNPEFQNVFPNDVQVLDINGDGHLDVVQVYAYVPEQGLPGIPIRVLLGDGHGNFSDGTATLFGTSVPTGDAASGVSVADFNGDGRLDVFIAQSGERRSGLQNGLLLSSGAAGVVDSALTNLPQVNDFTHWSTSGDIDGDGDIDIFVDNLGGDLTPGQGLDLSSYFLINDGSGVFSRSDARLPTNIENGNRGYTSSLLFDADNDGDKDLLLGAYTQDGLVASVVLFNDGSGHFLRTAKSELPSPNLGNANDVVLGTNAIDLNGDGYLDLFMLTTDYFTNRYIQVLINNGDGTFRDETSTRLDAFHALTPGVGFGRYLHLIDINNDGAIDLVEQTGGPQRFYLNDGTGHFVALPPDFLFTQGDVFSFVPGDFNEDGRVDIFAQGFVDANDPNAITEFDRVALWVQPAGLISNGDSLANAVLGDAASEALSGLGGNDIIFGGGGNDTLDGGDGDDYLNGGAGADAMSGGAGKDTYFVDSASDIVTESADAGVDTVNTVLGAYTLAPNLENLVYYGTGAFAGIGNGLNNSLTGGRGNDTMEGGVGNDTLDGGVGQDTASYAGAASRVVVNLALIGAQNTLSAGLDTLLSIENLTGSAFGDTLTGDAGNNVLSGGAGVDTLIGGLGDDVLIGGDNTDFIVDLSGVVSIDGGSGNEQITLGAAVVSGTVDGGVGTDQLTKGGSIAGLTLISIEILNTNGGTVTASAAQFEGFDTIRFSAAQPVTAISLALAAAGTVDLADELLGRRVIFAGTSGNDTITTSNGSDQIDGGAGDDVLTGNAGNDTLIGGLGDDTLSGGDGTDFLVDLSGIVAIDAGDGDDVITLGAAINAGTVAGGLGTDQLNKGGAIAGLTITGIEIVNTNGGTLTATAAQLEGFDTIRFSAAQSTTAVSLALSEAGTVDLVDELLGRRALFAGSSGNDVITTSNGSDQIDGGAGDDVLSGGAGVDTLIGGLGDDSLNGGDGGDFIVDLSGIVAIDAGDGDDVLTVGAGVVSGTIAGGLGTADQLNKSGNLSGITVSGVEIINTNGGTLTATAAQLESFDTIRFSAAQATAAISLVQSDAGTADLTDELLGRRVLYQGSSGNDVITLSDGADRLDGGSGDDTLNGGAGNDTLTGGLGDDLIVQGSSDGRDLIDGGAGTDTYQLNGTAAAETFRIMTRAEALLAGITGLAGSTEIVITKDGTDNASVIAELDNVEEIQINALLTTANNGNGAVDGGTDTGDTVIVLGDFTTTSLAYSTIHINGSLGNDTIDISGLTSAHRVVFASNGGSDTLIGDVRPQDVFEGMGGRSLHLGAGIESDFELMELVNHQTVTAVDAFDDHSLMRSGREMAPVDVTDPTGLVLSDRDLLTAPDAPLSVEYQIPADYALLQA